MAKRSFIKVIYMAPFSVCKYIINPKISACNPKPLFGRYMARKIVQNKRADKSRLHTLFLTPKSLLP